MNQNIHEVGGVLEAEMPCTEYKVLAYGLK